MEAGQGRRIRRTSSAPVHLTSHTHLKHPRPSPSQLLHCKTRREIARPVQEMVTEGFFKGQKKFCLAIEPTTLDIDVVVVSFLIMEKRRRDRVTGESMKLRHLDEDVATEGGCEAEMTGALQ